MSRSGAGALSIRRFEVSRWRGGHRSFRLWVFNSEYSLRKAVGDRNRKSGAVGQMAGKGQNLSADDVG